MFSLNRTNGGRTMRTIAVLLSTVLLCSVALAYDLAELPDLKVAPIKAENALWVENPIEEQFQSAKRIVVADLKGPGRVEMFHFAMPGTCLSRSCAPKPSRTYSTISS